MINSFEEIARIYDRMFLRDRDADREMLATLFDRHNVKTVLDCACGTGFHAEILAREGYRVVGSDASEPMLEVARSKLSAGGFDLSFYRSKWRDLPAAVPGRFDAVICMGNSLALELDDESVAASLAGMYAMLREGGVLLVSGTNVDRQLADNIMLEVVEPEPDCFLMNVREYGSDSTSSRFFYIDATGDEPSMRHFRFTFLNLTADRMEALLRRTGIEEYAFYGEKDLSFYSRRESMRLILVAERSRGRRG